MSEIEFKDIGLSKNEGKAYEALLQLGAASAAQISKQGGIPYGRIYDVLSSLEHKHLVSVLPEKTRRYVPADPALLHKYVLERKNSLDKAEEKIKMFKSVYAQQASIPVEIATGKGVFYRIHRSFPVAQRRAYSIKYSFDTHPEIIREIKSLRRKGVEHLTLGRIDDETKKNAALLKKINPAIKPMSNSGVAMSLVDDVGMFIVLIKSNTTIIIRDKAVIDLMAELFKSYYDTH